MTTRPFVNWAQTESSGRAVAWERPRSTAEIRDLLLRARRQHRRARPVGSGHSWSPIAVPEDIAIDLSLMRDVLEIDAAARRVRVQAGIRLRSISAALDRVGLALPVLGSIGEQTIAGAVSTGTHGSSLLHGNLASLLEELTLVTPSGEVHRLRRGEPSFDAAAVSLGALGVVAEVVLRVVPRFTLLGVVEPRSIPTLARDLEGIAKSSEFVKIWWLPALERAHVFRYERTPLAPRDVALRRWIDEHIVNAWIFPAALALSDTVPLARPWVASAVARAYLERPAVPLRSDLAFHVPMPPLHRETEYAFGLAEAGEALGRLASAIARARWNVDLPVEIRFVREDTAWMSPAYGRPTCQIGVYARSHRDRLALFSAFEDIAFDLGGRPHWGKETSATSAQLRAAYPRWDEFVALARRWDPDGTLRNAFLDRVLGL